MSQAITTSIRLPSHLSKKLERISHKLKKGKNGLIIEALVDYFGRVERLSLQEEAKRQSLLISEHVDNDEPLWEKNLDLDDWKS